MGPNSSLINFGGVVVCGLFLNMLLGYFLTKFRINYSWEIANIVTVLFYAAYLIWDWKRRRKKDNRQALKSTVEEVNFILLNDWDPIGIRNDPKAKSEYNQYALRIAGMLYNGTAQDKLAGYLDEVVVHNLGLKADRAFSDKISKKLLSIRFEKTERS